MEPYGNCTTSPKQKIAPNNNFPDYGSLGKLSKIIIPKRKIALNRNFPYYGTLGKMYK